MAMFQIGHGYMTLWEAHLLATRLRQSIRNGSRRPGRKLRYFLPRPLLGDADVIGVFQVEPELRACAEPVPETKSGAAPNSSPPASDVSAPLSNAATTGRPSTCPNTLGSALHSVCIGPLLRTGSSRSHKTTFA